MKPIRIVHFADVHLGMENYGKLDPETGLNSRLKDFTKSFDTIVDYVLKNDIDLVVFAGDAYKTREPSPTFQREFAQRIYKIATANIPIVMVVGNHDFPNALGKADTLEIFPTLSVPNIHTFQKEGLETIQTKSGPLQIAGLPWFTRSQLLTKSEMMQKNSESINQVATKKVIEKIRYLSSKINDKIPAILVAHASIEKAVYGSERQVMIGSELVIPIDVFRQSKFEAVFLGHLHKFQQVSLRPPVVYSGSIERVDFGEEKEAKGFVVAEINHRKPARIQFQKLSTRPFISIRVKVKTADDPNPKIIQEIKKHNIIDAIVKIIVEIPEEIAGEIREGAIREALKEAAFIAGVVKEVRLEARIKTENGFSDELANLDPVGLLEKYLKSKKVSKSRIDTLKKETEKLIEEDRL